MTRPSIYEAAGGMPAFVALAAAHHERCLADPELEHAFSHGGKHDHLDRLAAYWAEVLGGPPTYSREYGGHSAMVDLHAGEGIGADWSLRFVDCFVAAADDAGLPTDPDLRAALRAYMEWATAELEPYAPTGSVVPPALEMPHWSWDGLDRR
jgi:hemoglobin